MSCAAVVQSSVVSDVCCKPGSSGAGVARGCLPPYCLAPVSAASAVLHRPGASPDVLMYQYCEQLLVQSVLASADVWWSQIEGSRCRDLLIRSMFHEPAVWSCGFLAGRGASVVAAVLFHVLNHNMTLAADVYFIAPCLFVCCGMLDSCTSFRLHADGESMVRTIT